MRTSRSLSDLKGYDPQIHGGTTEGVLRAITNAFGAKNRKVRHADLVTLAAALAAVAPRIRDERGSLFTPAAFADLVMTGKALALRHFRGASRGR